MVECHLELLVNYSLKTLCRIKDAFVSTSVPVKASAECSKQKDIHIRQNKPTQPALHLLQS